MFTRRYSHRKRIVANYYCNVIYFTEFPHCGIYSSVGFPAQRPQAVPLDPPVKQHTVDATAVQNYDVVMFYAASEQQWR